MTVPSREWPIRFSLLAISSGYNFGDNQLFLPYEIFQKHYGVRESISKIYITGDNLENVEKSQKR